jgi:copper(I)-binding protein
MAAYMVLENLSDKDQILTNVNSPAFDRVEVHRTEVREGMARMMPVEQVTIEPHAKAAFELGGYHLMLVGPHRPLRNGDVVELTLEFAGGERVSANSPVRKATPGGEAHQHDHH